MTARRLNGVWHVKTATGEALGLNLASCIKLLKTRSKGV